MSFITNTAIALSKAERQPAKAVAHIPTPVNAATVISRAFLKMKSNTNTVYGKPQKKQPILPQVPSREPAQSAVR